MSPQAIKAVIYAILAIAVLALIYAIIRQFKGALGGSGGGGKDVYLRKSNLLVSGCNDTYINSLNKCNKDKVCLEDATKKWNSCITNNNQ